MAPPAFPTTPDAPAWLPVLRRLSREINVLLIVACAALAPILNHGHQAEQYIYEHRHKVLGTNLWSGAGYVYAPGGRPATYPIWGYPILVGVVRSDVLLELLQAGASALTCLIVCWRSLDRPRSLLLTP